jgi:hypothetical protein
MDGDKRRDELYFSSTATKPGMAIVSGTGLAHSLSQLTLTTGWFGVGDKKLQPK